MTRKARIGIALATSLIYFALLVAIGVYLPDRLPWVLWPSLFIYGALMIGGSVILKRERLTRKTQIQIALALSLIYIPIFDFIGIYLPVWLQWLAWPSYLIFGALMFGGPIAFMIATPIMVGLLTTVFYFVWNQIMKVRAKNTPNTPAD